jgi:hypothetical protein
VIFNNLFPWPYAGKGPEYRHFSEFCRVPSTYEPQAQISNRRRACTQALPLYLWIPIKTRSDYTESGPMETWRVFFLSFYYQYNIWNFEPYLILFSNYFKVLLDDVCLD